MQMSGQRGQTHVGEGSCLDEHDGARLIVIVVFFLQDELQLIEFRVLLPLGGQMQ